MGGPDKPGHDGYFLSVILRWSGEAAECGGSMNADAARNPERLNRAVNSPSPVFMGGPNKSGHDGYFLSVIPRWSGEAVECGGSMNVDAGRRSGAAEPRHALTVARVHGWPEQVGP